MSKAVVKSTSSGYATAPDFRAVFANDRRGLHRLSLLLLGSEENTEQCIQRALDECIEAASVFQPFAKSWARRCIIRTALQLTDMRKQGSPHAVHPALSTDNPGLHAREVCSNIIALPGLQRFVFVMSALEQYNDQECSLLLRCSRNDVCDARARTWRHMEEACEVGESKCIAAIQAWLTCSDWRAERDLKRVEHDTPNRAAAIHFHLGNRCPLVEESL